jgi:hypothetical protein
MKDKKPGKSEKWIVPGFLSFILHSASAVRETGGKWQGDLCRDLLLIVGAPHIIKFF